MSREDMSRGTAAVKTLAFKSRCEEDLRLLSEPDQSALPQKSGAHIFIMTVSYHTVLI